jgi:hypothetical protein
MTIVEFLTAQGLTAEEITALTGNEKQAKALTAALSKFEEGNSALTKAAAEKKETTDYWESKTTELQNSVTRLTAAEKRAAQESAEAARVKQYMKSLADQGYDVPKDMYEGAAATTTTTTSSTGGDGPLTRDEVAKMLRGTAPDLVALSTISNEYLYLTGEPYLNGEADLTEAMKLGKSMRDHVAGKYDFQGKRQAKTQAAEDTRINKLVEERYKTKEAELAAKYGSNPEVRTPMPSKFARLNTEPGFKSDSWKSKEGRDANREARLKKFENVTLQ